jgi:hypothetical protein
MTTIKVTPSTFSYICQEYTIFPGIVREQIADGVADGTGTVILQLSNDRDTDSNIKKLRKYLEENF